MGKGSSKNGNMYVDVICLYMSVMCERDVLLENIMCLVINYKEKQSFFCVPAHGRQLLSYKAKLPDDWVISHLKT